MRVLHCTVGLIALAFATAAGMHGPVQPAPAATEFTVFLRGAPVGTIEATVDRSAAGIVISGTTRLGPPLAVNVRRAEVRYDPDWKPLEFTLDAFVRNQALRVRTTFGGGTATSEVTLVDKTSTKTDPVTPDTIVLSNSFYGTYEALAARLASARAGSEVRAYITPQAELTVKVTFVTEERLQVPGRTVVTRHFQLVLENPGAPIEADLWSDRDGRLVRFSVPGESLDIVRADVATVAARRETVSRAGDQSVTIPANGFVLAATISRPAAGPTAPKAKLPAVVLVSGSEPTDRDATVSNVPIFAQIAGALADTGFLVVRYDKRGVGQSGGRIEAATIADYADDAVAVTRYLEKRKDVDRRRIAVVGYGEGGWIALVAGSRNSGIAALALVATAGTTGAELMLERQRHALERLQIPDAEKLARVEFQQKLQQAVLTGAGWEAVPPELRRQADTPWFRSFLAFDPARIMTKVRRPILILQGALDRQVSMSQFEKLTAAAKARKPRQGQTVEPRTIDGINHLLVPARTGEIDEYATLTDQNVARELLETLGTWLKATLGGVDRK